MAAILQSIGLGNHCGGSTVQGYWRVGLRNREAKVHEGLCGSKPLGIPYRVGLQGLGG